MVVWVCGSMSGGTCGWVGIAVLHAFYSFQVMPTESMEIATIQKLEMLVLIVRK